MCTTVSAGFIIKRNHAKLFPSLFYCYYNYILLVTTAEYNKQKCSFLSYFILFGFCVPFILDEGTACILVEGTACISLAEGIACFPLVQGTACIPLVEGMACIPLVEGTACRALAEDTACIPAEDAARMLLVVDSFAYKLPLCNMAALVPSDDNFQISFLVVLLSLSSQKVPLVELVVVFG